MLWEQQEWPLPSTDHWQRPAHSGLRREKGEGGQKGATNGGGRAEEGKEGKRWLQEQDIISCSYYNEVISSRHSDGGFLSSR